MDPVAVIHVEWDGQPFRHDNAAADASLLKGGVWTEFLEHKVTLDPYCSAICSTTWIQVRMDHFKFGMLMPAEPIVDRTNNVNVVGTKNDVYTSSTEESTGGYDPGSQLRHSEARKDGNVQTDNASHFPKDINLRHGWRCGMSC
ncbi:unnamed protein product [Protopolystoma xenopodis]|uniref:Uncharacterized protein n=1 Tax=Protopolystoma xenopodis TaxID=117903 RepID=A0A448XLU0_9PLAT|nr:unnamed protein product [Protopolystoma xenopodis]